MRYTIRPKKMKMFKYFRVVTGDVDDGIGFVSVCIFYQEKGTFGAYGSMNYT